MRERAGIAQDSSVYPKEGVKSMTGSKKTAQGIVKTMKGKRKKTKERIISA
jgi:hypothetical protein